MTMPAFVLIRERHVEIETGLTLAGKLVTSIPSQKKPNRKRMKAINQVIAELLARAEQMADDAIVYCWDRGARPPGAVNPTDAEVGAWAEDHIVVAVRIDPNSDCMLRLGE